MQSEVLDNMSAQMDAAADPLPEGEYAIVEAMGHRKLIGRVSEIDRFGSKMLGIEPIFQGKLLPMCLLNGTSIFQFTPCSAEVARKYAPKDSYHLPGAVQAIIPGTLLAHHVDDEEDDHDELDEDFQPGFLRD